MKQGRNPIQFSSTVTAQGVIGLGPRRPNCLSILKILSFILFSCGSLGCPRPAFAATNILVYYSSCDGGLGPTLLHVAQDLALNAAYSVTTIDVACNTAYNPIPDTWNNYDQVWDVRFYTSNQGCTGITTYADYFGANWQTAATSYVGSDCGSLFLLGENSGFGSRNNGNFTWEQSVGAIAAGFTVCYGPTYATSTDFGSNTGVYAMAAPIGGTADFQDQGGIPDAGANNYLNGTSLINFSTNWTNVNESRAAAAVWNGAAQMTALSGCHVGKLATFFDMDQWSWGGGYTNAVGSNVADGFVNNVATWFGARNCSCATNTQTNTSTNTPVNTPTNTQTPTNTVTNSQTQTNTNTVTNSQTETKTSTQTQTQTNTNTPTQTFTDTQTNTSTNTATIQNTPTNTNTNTQTVTNTITNSQTNTPTVTDTQTHTVTNTETNTAVNTFTSTSTNTVTNTQTNTPVNTNTNTATSTVSNTQTSTATSTSTSLNTFTSTSTNTVTNTQTNTPVNTNTNTNTATSTVTKTQTNTATSTSTALNTFTDTSTNTSTSTPLNTFTSTNTVTYTSTNTSTNTPLNTNTATNTTTYTSTNTSTSTSVNTFTSTNTATFTSTSTDTALNTSTYTQTATSTTSNTQTQTNTDTATLQNTATSTNTNTSTNTVTSTQTSTDTDTPSPTPTNSQTSTSTGTSSSTPTSTGTSTNTATTTPMNTNTSTSTNTNTFTVTHTQTSTPTSTNSVTNTQTSTSSPTQTNTSTYSPTNTNTSTSTPTNTQTSTPTTGITIAKQVSESQAHSGDVLTYTISVNVTSSNVTGLVINDTLPAGVSFVGFGSGNIASGTFTAATDLIQWVMPSPLSTGNYQLTYQTKVDDFLPANTVLLNKAQATAPGVPSLTTSVPVTVIGNYTVKINVYNSAGEVVKTILIQNFTEPITTITLSASNTISTLQGPGSVINIIYDGVIIGSWDGSNNSGSPVSNGSYLIQVDNMGQNGVVTSVSQKAIVNRQMTSTTASVFNMAGEKVRDLYSVVSDPAGVSMTDVSLSASIFKPGVNNLSSGSASIGAMNLAYIYIDTSGSPITLTWDGTTNSGNVVTPGTYTIQVHWSNNGQTTDISRNIVVVGEYGVVGNVIAKPNILNQSNGWVTTFDSSAVQNANSLKVRIYTLAGQLVKVIPPNSGELQATWDTQSGVASGLYIASVEVYNSNGGLITRQHLKVMMVH